MSAFPGPEIDRPRTGADVGANPAQFDLYAHIEGLCSEESRLLETAAHERSEEQHQRLHEIGHELDRSWEHLRERAERLGHRRPGTES
jgi:hypothetical protein